MAVQYSIQKMVSDGTLSTIALGIQYLQRNDIYIRIAGEETPQSGASSGYTWSFINNTTLKILPVVPNGVEVVVYRRTDVDAMYNIYSQNAQFDEATIDENNQQLLYIAQEYLEQGIPGAGVATIEFLRDDGSYTYYRIKRTDGSYSDEFSVPSAGSVTKVLAREAVRRSYAESGLNLVNGSFQIGFTLVNASDVALDESVGKCFSGPAGSYPAGTSTAGFTDVSGELLRNKCASGVALSHLIHLPTPLETALELHRQYKVELIIDCDCEYSYMLIKPGDSIRCVGWPTLTKKDNGVPPLAATQAPERPAGYLDNFNVNAFFVVYHEANNTAARVRVSGGLKFYAAASVALEKYAHIPRLAFSHISDIRADSQYISNTLDGFHFKDEYANTIKDIHLLNAGMARQAFLWDDGSYGTGTSTTGEGLHAVGFRFPFKAKCHSYSTLTNCGGENVGIKDELGAVLPIVFDLEDSCFTLNSPSTEHLHGGFLKVSRTLGGWPATVTVNTPQANVAIYGSKDNTSAKLLDVRDGASVVVNGNFMTPAASGYHLKFGGANNDSSLQLNGFDPNFLMGDIKADTENYTGIHEVNCSRVAMSATLYGINGDYSTNGQLPFSFVENDDFGMKSGPSSFTVRRGMYARVSAALRSRPNTSGYASIKVNGTEKDRVYFLSTAVGESVTLSYDGRISGGSVVSLEINLTSGAIAGQDWYDCKFSIVQK